MERIVIDLARMEVEFPDLHCAAVHCAGGREV